MPSLSASVFGGLTLGGLCLLLPELRAELAAGAPLAPAGEARAAENFGFSGGILRLRAPATRRVYIRAGTFTMGSTPTDILEAVALCTQEPLNQRCSDQLFSNELPQRSVELSAFWLDRTEVTVRDYARCVRAGRCAAVPFERGASRFERPEYPVTFVTWTDARNYCEFRHARLPTEAEFERAARGVTGRRYPWGELYNRRASNHGRLGIDVTDESDGFAELAPAGSFPQGQTPEGVLDLAGNAAEWVYDLYTDTYDAESLLDPSGPQATASGERGLRGGHFGSGAAWLRGAARAHSEPEARKPYLGFRCAKSALASAER